MSKRTTKWQVMPPLDPEQYADLEQSIRTHGVQAPILEDEDGNIIDGHTRREIVDRLRAEGLEIECFTEVVEGKTDAELRSLAYELNLSRRHLTREQRRGLIADSLLADPSMSDLQHAKRTGTSDKTVATVRGQMAGRSEIPNVSEREDSQGRKQPSKKPTRRPPKAVEVEEPTTTSPKNVARTAASTSSDSTDPIDSIIAALKQAVENGHQPTGPQRTNLTAWHNKLLGKGGAVGPRAIQEMTADEPGERVRWRKPSSAAIGGEGTGRC